MKLINERIEELREALIQSTQELLRIKSVEEEAKENAPFGEGVKLALDKALDISNKLGFKTVNLDGYAGYAEYGEGEEYIGVLGHLDVVPEGDGWIYPPYGAEIHEGKIFARGAMDDKGPIMAALFGLKAIKDLSLPIKRKVRIIFGTNEETGSADIEHYMNKEKAPIAGFTPDAEYPIIYAEKGLTSFNLTKSLSPSSGDLIVEYIKGGQRANMVPDYCEAALRFSDKEIIKKKIEKIASRLEFSIKTEEKGDLLIIKSLGVSAHGSVPELGKNAIMQLIKVLNNLEITGELGALIDFLDSHIGLETNGESFGVGLKDEVSGSLSFNLGIINYTEGKFLVTLNLRYPVTFQVEDMLKPLNKTIEKIGLNLEEFEHQKPLYFPQDHSIIKTLQKVYKEQTGLEPKLLAIGGGTYAKEMPNIVAFGPIFPGKPDLDHQANEYIEVEDLVLNAKIYAEAIYELSNL